MLKFIVNFLVIFSLCIVSQALADKFEVGPGKQYTSIQSAINAATDGDKIFIDPGTYLETINLRKKLELIGTGDNPSHCVVEGQGLLLRIAGIQKGGIRNITFRSRGSSTSPLAHISNTGNRFQIRNSIFDGASLAKTGILFDGQSTPQMINLLTHSFVHTGWEVAGYAKPEASNCSFLKNGHVALSYSDNSGGSLVHCQFRQSSGGAINAIDRTNLLIKNNVISDQQFALHLAGDAKFIVDNTIVSNTRQPSIIGGQSKVTFTRSTLIDNPTGVFEVTDGATLTLQIATFRNNKNYSLKSSGRGVLMLSDVFFEQGETGLIISENSSLTAQNCQFSGLSKGIVQQTGDTGKQLISNSVFNRCSTGIVFSDETSVTVEFCTFIDCDTGIKASDNVMMILSETIFSNSAQFAITMLDKAEMIVKKCAFRGGQSGVFLDGETILQSSENQWHDISHTVADIQGNALFVATKDSFENLQQGIVLKGGSVGNFLLCDAKMIGKSWIAAEGTAQVSVENSRIHKSDIGFNITGNASLTSKSNTFSECEKAAVRVTKRATVYSESDRFKSNNIAIESCLDNKSPGIDVKKATFSKQKDKTLAISGMGSVIIENSNFIDEKNPIELKDNASATLKKPTFDGVESGGVRAYGQSQLTIADASFKGLETSLFFATETSHLTFEKVIFIGGKGTVIDAEKKAGIEFIECELRNIDGFAIEARDQVTIKIAKSALVNLKTPIKIGANTNIYLSDVIIQNTAEGIRITGQANLDVHGLSITGSKQQALFLNSTGSIEIHDTVIDSRDIGIVSSGQSKPIFSGLKITADNVGIKLIDNTQCQINDLEIRKSEIGLFLENNALLNLKKGEMADVAKAVVAKDKVQATINGITVKKSQHGVVLGGEARVDLSDSDITAVENGIILKDKAAFEGEEILVRVKYTGLDLQADTSVDLKNFRVLLTNSKGVGVAAVGNASGLIDGLYITGGKLGMKISESLPLVFSNINLSRNKEAGLIFEGNASTKIVGGIIEGNRKGIVMSGEAVPSITGVTCVKCDTGFIVTDSAQPRLNKCGVQGSKNGIIVEKNSKPNISEFHATDGTGFGNGVLYRDKACGSLEEPQINGAFQNGIIIYDQASPFIWGTTETGHVRDCMNGIAVMGLGNPTIFGLLIENNKKDGIILQGSGNSDNPVSAYISGCRIRSHMGGAGIHVGEDSKAYILGLFRDDVNVPLITTYYQNIIRSNLIGIMVADNGDAMIDGNMIENNGVGIEVTEKSTASIHRNHIRESKFIVMDKGGVGIFVKDKAKVSITDHNRVYKNRAAGILITSSSEKNLIENNEIYSNVNLPSGSNLDVNSMGAVMVDGAVKMDFHSNYLHDNKSAGAIVLSAVTADFRNNLFERNQRSALQLNQCSDCVVENNTFVGTKNNDIGLLFGRSYLKNIIFQNNLLSKFSKAFNALDRITSINKKWMIRRNSIHNCELENGPNLPDLLKNYKLDPIFADPNGKGVSAFTPEPGSNICFNSKIYDWGETRYCGAFECREEGEQDEDVRLTILSPQQDGDIVPRKLIFKANVMIPEQKDIASWELYVNGNLVKQSRGINIVSHEDDSEISTEIKTSISSLPYGKSLIRIEVNSSKGEQWTAERTVYTASCSERHKRWVILVGISDYDDEGGVPDLTYAASDVLALRKMLDRRSPYSPFQDVEVITLIDEQATREGLREVLFGKIAPCVQADDEVIVFFAGHGAVEKDRFYLVLHDSDLNRLELTGYEMQELRDVIRYNIKSNNITLLFDACHSGGVNLERSPANVLNTHLNELAYSTQNLNIITASQGDEVSYEFSDCCLNKVNGSCADDTPFTNDGHGAFTCTLLHAMMGYEAEENKKQMTFTDLSQFVQKWLPILTENQQHPQILSNSNNTLNVITSISNL